jgi:hypothetical protein
MSSCYWTAIDTMENNYSIALISAYSEAVRKAKIGPTD